MNKLVVVRKCGNVKHFKIEGTHKSVCFAAYNQLPNKKCVHRTHRLFVIFNKHGILIFFVAMATPY